MKKPKTLKPKSSKSEAENDSAENNDLAENSESEKFLIVGIGASAGGVHALKSFFENVPVDSGVAYVVILHLSPDHDSRLAEVLQTVATIPVAQVKERVKVEPNRVYVVPPNQHLEMNDGHIVVSPILTLEERHAPVDIFFRTLAESHAERAVAVILSGTGADGSMGVKRLKENGGVIFVQNPREAEFSEMPRNSIATDLVDLILNVGDIPAQIVAYRNNPGKIEITAEVEKKPKEKLPENPHEQALLDIFTQLRVRTGHDFADYKRATILRRIERRINVRELPDIVAYAAYLRENRDETQALLKDLLISVTNFFRDKETFAYLESEVLPKLFDKKTADDTIRVWVAGCATGEEAYSLAMSLAEQSARAANAPTVQIFATDIDEAAVAKAREGFYTLNDAADVPPERLKRFFIKETGGFRIRRELREMILFARHNVIKDPPFSRLDLVTCRNMLIYLNHAAQERVMKTFHFSLNAGGYLFLGNSETVDGAGNLYATVSREHHIYQSRRTVPRVGYPVPDAAGKFGGAGLVPARDSLSIEPSEASENGRGQAPPLRQISFGDLHQRLLEEYTPSIVVNEDDDIVHMSESSLKFLKMNAGEPTQNLLKLVRPELRIELRTALYQAAQKQKNVEVPNVKIKFDGKEESIDICVRPVMRQADQARGFVLVLFETAKQSAGKNGNNGRNETGETVYISDEPIARLLEEELIRAKAQLRAAVEQYEEQAKELKASNEELQASNEELRSSSEELETGKEELQSVNEELNTVNQELKIKIEEISQTSGDLNNLINSTDIGTIFLDRNLRIKMFTPPARDVFNLIDADVNRPLADITTKLVYADLHADVERVLDTLQTIEREFETAKGKWYLLRVFPYRTKEDKISGAVVTFVEITTRVETEQALHHLMQSREQQRRIFDTTLSTINDFAYIFDKDGRFVYSNQPLLDLLGITFDEITGKNFFDLNYPEDLAARLQSQIRQVFETGQTVRDETPFTSPTGADGFYEYIFNPVFGEGGAVESVAGSTRDITEHKQSQAALGKAHQRLQMAMRAGRIFSWEMNPATRRIEWSNDTASVVGFPLPADLGETYAAIHPDDAPDTVDRINRAIETGGVYESEFRLVNPANGEALWFHSQGAVTTETADRQPRFFGITQNIDERKRSEENLRESEESLRLLVESASDYAIFTITLDGLINSWNAGAAKIFGWTESEAVGQTGALIFTPEDRAAGAPEEEISTALKNGRAPDERLHIRKDGSRFPVSGVLALLRNQDGGARGFVKIARDMTEQIEAERALRDKETLQKLVGAQETERRRIARDLHDELGQQLTALRLKLDHARKICDDAEMRGKIDEIELIAKGIDNGVDFLAWELRPAALDDLGLIVALENYVKQWSHHSGITSELLASSLKRTRFAPEVETNLYRIVQEALNNTHKHANAKSVEVVLEKRDGLIVLLIEDDGAGFNLKNKKNRLKGLGLTGMKERAALVGGTFEIESAPGQGTTVYVRVPVSAAKRRQFDGG